MFFLVNKPKGVTSHDIVDKFKRIFHDEKIGHSGTLDPMATGLLIIGIKRESTKYLGHLQGMDKTYYTEIDFSILTDTWDMDFYDTIKQYELIFNSEEKIEKIIEEKKLNKGIYYKIEKKIKNDIPDINIIKKELDKLVPQAILPLTMFSAKKKDGKKLYELAREGINLNLKSEMKINNYKIIEYKFPILKLELNVGSGTYIRSIGYHIGKQLGLGGTLKVLHRKNIGNFEL